MGPMICKICGLRYIYPRGSQTIRNVLDEHLVMCPIVTSTDFMVFYEQIDSLVPVHFVVYKAGKEIALCSVYQRYHPISLGEWQTKWAVLSSSWLPETFDDLRGLLSRLNCTFGIPV